MEGPPAADLELSRAPGGMKLATLVTLTVAVVLVSTGLLVLTPLAVRTLAYEPYTIPSAAMEPTLRQGDYVVVSKGAYGYSRHSILGSPSVMRGRLGFQPPRRGDVVVFKLPRDGRTSYIKRLIGLAGDRVQIRRGVVLINQTPMRQRVESSIQTDDRGYPEQASVVREFTPEGRSYLVQIHGADEPADNTGVYLVPPHCYFVLGDNRENSADSRFDPGLPPSDPKLGGCGWDGRVDSQVGDEEGVGFVPEENLVGKAWVLLRRDPSVGVESIVVQ